jgi:bacillolysin
MLRGLRTTSRVVGVMLIMMSAQPILALNNSTSQSRIDQVTLDSHRGTAEIVSGEMKVNGANYVQAAENFIASRQDLFGLKDPVNELTMVDQQTDKLGMTHVRLDQVYQGLPVWGCQRIVHFKDASSIYLVGGQTIPTPTISVLPSLSSSTAEATALNAVKDMAGADHPRFETRLIIFPDQSVPRLAYQVTVRSVTNNALWWQVFVDAKTGLVIEKYNDLKEDGPTVGSGMDVNGNIRTLQTYQVGSTIQLVDATKMMYTPPEANLKGVIATYNNVNNGGSLYTDPNGDNNFNDNTSLKGAVSGHYYAGLVYEFYRTSIGRNSFDNAGSSIIVNVHDPLYVNNAYWDGSKLNFCDGDGTTYKNFAGSLDVIGHEFTHGVTERTAGLIYQFQSGALNESFSDFFGAMIDSANWLMGEEIRITAPGFLRSMQDPHDGPNPFRFPFGYQPAKLSEYVDSGLNYDNGGVHTNSGIPNKAGYLVGSTIGRTKAAQIWYRTLTTYLTPSSDFSFWGTMTLQSAVDLYGDPSPEVQSVVNALDSIGFPLIFVTPSQVAPLSAALGALSDTTIEVKNRRSETVTVQSATTTNGKVTVTGTFPTPLATDAAMSIQISFDATTGFTPCDVGTIEDTVVLTTSSIILPTIRIPISVALGYVKAAYKLTTATTSCLTATVANRPVVTSFVRNSVNALSKATLLAGFKSGSDTTVYMDMYQTPTYSVVDSITSSTAGNGDIIDKARIASKDGRIQGTVKYQYEPSDVAGCGYIIADFTLRNACGSQVVLLSGLLADYDIPSSGSNKCNFDVANKLVYVQNSGNTTACALALLSKTPRNLRAINNPTLIYNGLTQGSAYKELAATANVSGTTNADWSALLTFGQDTLKVGDSVHYRTAMLYSTTGSSGFAAILAQINPTSCCVGLRGNVNQLGAVDLADLSAMVSYLTGGGYVLPCVDAANVNGLASVDLADLSALVSYLTGGGYSLPACPQ